MATSGSKTVEIRSWIDIKFSWWQNSQSVADNTTTIGWKLEAITGNGALYIKNRTWKVNIDGTEYTGKVNISLDEKSTQTLATGTATIKHNNDGSKIFSYSFTQQFDLTLNSGIWMGTYSGSGSDTLTTIARASQPSLVTYPNTTQNIGNFGEEFSIHMNTASQSFAHTVRYEYGNRSGTIATGVVNGTTWAVPLEFMNDIPNDTSGSGRIYVDTYSGSTKIGTKYTGFTATVPASVKPECTVQVLDNTTIQKTYGNLVKGLSKLYVKTNFYGSYGSTVDKYNVTANGVKYDKAEIVTGVISKAGTTTVEATVTDSRGRTSDKVSAPFTVLDYASPKISSLSVHRCNEDGTANDRGEYVEILFSGEVTPLNNKNTATYTIRYKKSSATSWTNLVTDANNKTPNALANNYSVSDESYIIEADGSSSYDIEVTVRDNHNSDTRPTSASTAFTLMNFHPDGSAIRFGGVAEEENSFQNDLTFIQTGNQYCFSSVGAASTDGYILMARITVTETNSDSPITFVFSRRKAIAPMTVHVLFKSTADTDPGLASIRYEGDNYDAYLTSPAESVWDLYVKKVSNADTITMNSWHTSYRQMKRINMEFIGSIESTVPHGRFGYYHATPSVLPSIIDCILPVGMIIQLYSHADPNDMYPGTTWVRLVNTFLWGCDANGGIGTTGGEKTHTLTVNELPTHTHGAVYSGNADGTKTHAWLASGGSAMAYGTIETGGGAAHNNMPPYTQVSIWRRTS